MKDFALFVVGCEKHLEVAQRNYLFLRKNAPSLLKKAIYITDHLPSIPKTFFENIFVYENSNYSTRLLRAIDAVQAEYIILILDDDFITARLHDNLLTQISTFLDVTSTDYLKLIEKPSAKKNFTRIENIGSSHCYNICRQTLYGVSLQPSVWKREFLREACIIGEQVGKTAWDMEIACFKVQKKPDLTLTGMKGNILGIRNAVYRGKLFRFTNKLLRENGFDELDMATMSVTDSFIFNIKTLIAKTPLRGIMRSVLRPFVHLYSSDMKNK